MHEPRVTNLETGGASIKLVLNIPDWLAKPFISILLLYRRLRYGYPFRRIPLTKGKFAIVDPEDFDRLSIYKWFASKNGSTFYAKRHTRTGEHAKTTSVCMHREIMNAPDNLVVDHINYNGLDNRKANLRLATRRQNSLHVIRTMNPGSSKYKGVSWHTYKKRWGAQITYNGKTTFLGYFKDEIQAAKVYDKAARIYHAEFAALNFPP